MKKKVFVCLAIVVVAIIAVIAVIVHNGKNKKNEDGTEKTYGVISVSKPHIFGKILEIKEDRLLLIEVTKEDKGFKLGDTVLVKYSRLKKESKGTTDSGYIEVEPVLNDVVVVQYWEGDIRDKDGVKYLEVEGIEMYE